nr:MAG TPA: Protein of unknown function (DUF2782) [Caudoviricetes sp.]
MGQLNPTRQEILDAHNALEELKNVALSAADFCGDTEKFLMWKDEILKALPLRPLSSYSQKDLDTKVAGGHGIHALQVQSEDGLPYYILDRDDDGVFTVASPICTDHFLTMGDTLYVTGRRYRIDLEEVQE